MTEMTTMRLNRNPIAKDLRTPKYAKRIMKSKKVYNRKKVVAFDR